MKPLFVDFHLNDDIVNQRQYKRKDSIVGFLNKFFKRPKYSVRSEINIPVEYGYTPSGKHTITHLDPVDQINLSVLHDLVEFFHTANFFDEHGLINVWTTYNVCNGLKIRLSNDPFGEYRDEKFHRLVSVGGVWINGDQWDSWRDPTLKNTIDRFNEYITVEYKKYKEKLKKEDAIALATEIQQQAKNILG